MEINRIVESSLYEVVKIPPGPAKLGSLSVSVIDSSNYPLLEALFEKEQLGFYREGELFLPNSTQLEDKTITVVREDKTKERVKKIKDLKTLSKKILSQNKSPKTKSAPSQTASSRRREKKLERRKIRSAEKKEERDQRKLDRKDRQQRQRAKREELRKENLNP